MTEPRVVSRVAGSEGGVVSALEVERLSVRRREVRVVDGVSFALASREILAVVGPNGSGKTSLVRAIQGSIAREAGDVRLAGQSVGALSARDRARRMAVVAQENPLDFDFTVEELVLLGRSPHKRLLESEGPSDWTAVEEALAAMRLSELRHRSVGTLSGGERQRAFLARAIAQQPEVLVLDEPTNHLDIRAQLEILALVRDLRVTVLAVLHDLNQVFGFASRVLLLERGKPRAIGTPDEVLRPALLSEVFGLEVKRILIDGGEPVLTFRRSAGT